MWKLIKKIHWIEKVFTISFLLLATLSIYDGNYFQAVHSACFGILILIVGLKQVLIEEQEELIDDLLFITERYHEILEPVFKELEESEKQTED